ncbi:hypothetical protein RAA17_03735 [Komagataeibacter rhaeticus]|nr:hypothetical protein [Komagataeibacter rhaeticus]
MAGPFCIGPAAAAGQGGLNDGPSGSILMPWPINRAMTRSWKDIQLKNITSKSLFQLRGRLLAGVMMALPVAGVLPAHGAHAADQLGEKVGVALQKAQTELAAKNTRRPWPMWTQPMP